MKINVLVTAAGSAISHGIIKSLKASSLDFSITTTDNQPYAAGLYRGDAGYLVPLAKSSSFIEEVIKICRKENINSICIGTDYELLPFAENKKRIEKETNAKVIVSHPDIIKIANDKWLTHLFLVKNKFPSIPSALPEDASELIEKEGFPLIVKPRISDSSKNTFIVNNKAGLNSKLEFLAKDKSNRFVNGKICTIIQKYMGNEENEFTSSTVVFDNKSYGIISMRREMRFGGHTTKAIIDDFPEVSSMVTKVAQRLNPFGPCNFQSRLVDGVPYIFEINSRFSGTTGICSQVGFNSVEACIRKVVLKEEPKMLSYKKGVMLRYFNEVFISSESIAHLKEEKMVRNPESEINSYL